jgi:flagellar biogenesis protein FliO
MLAGSALAAETDTIPRATKELPNASASAVAVSRPGYDTTRVGMALICVVGLILGLKWASGKFLGGGSLHRSSRAVSVLCRNTIGPKQNLVLVQVGRRLVLVGDCGNSLTTLGEITDADEIAEVVGQVSRERSEPLTRTFGNLFKKAENNFDDSADEASEVKRDSDEEQGAMASDLVGLSSQIRNLSRQFSKA